MPSGESYYDRGSMDIDHVESMEESTIGGMLRKKVYKVDDDMEMSELRKKAKEMGDGDFVPVSDDYGNELCVYVDDFPELAKEARGSEVMFVVRGSINKVESHKDSMMGKPKIRIYVWDSALVHGACGKKKDYK